MDPLVSVFSLCEIILGHCVVEIPLHRQSAAARYLSTIVDHFLKFLDL